jgi:dihydroorotate dehydrogenase electron transfer subunit
MAKRIENLKIIENKRLNNDFFVLELTGESKMPEMLPGQFVQVKVAGSPETFLRRPFSVHDVDYARNTLKMLIQIAGNGSKTLSKLCHGDTLNIIYPLGNSFTPPPKTGKSLLVGGGCGIAPLLFLGNYLKKNGFISDILLGFRNKERIIEYEEYMKIGQVYLTTEDGSLGEKGYITDHSLFYSQSYSKIFCCGPESMMKEIAHYCNKNKLDCEVSLENLMACGIGACLCCVVDTKKGNKCSCIDGPVFNIKELKW